MKNTTSQKTRLILLLVFCFSFLSMEMIAQPEPPGPPGGGGPPPTPINGLIAISLVVGAFFGAKRLWGKTKVNTDHIQLSVDDGLALSKFSIYPNPVENNGFFIALPQMAGEKIQVSLFNILGQKVYKNLEIVPSNERLSVPVHSLQAGVYMV